MIFNSFVFWAFFAVVITLYWVLPHRAQNRMLIVAGYIFYGCLGLALPRAAVDVDRGRLLGGPAAGDHWRSAAQEADPHGLDRLQPRRARVLQVLRLRRRTGGGAARAVRLPGAFQHAVDPAAGRHLLLHVPEHELHDRRLPRQMPARSIGSRTSRVRRLFPAARRRADRAGRAPAAAVDVAAPLPAGRLRRRPGAGPVRPVQEGRRRRQPGADREPDLRRRRRPSSPPREVLVGVYAFAFQIYGDFSGYSDIAQRRRRSGWAST